MDVRHLLSSLLVAVYTLHAGEGAQCPGAIAVPGIGQVNLVNAKWNIPGDPAGPLEVELGGVITTHLKSRTYFGDYCVDGAYDNQQYKAFLLLGKTLKYSTDISGAGCGCNAALYLTALKQNTNQSECDDHYCDAAKVCGVSCAEIDIQEANMHAWRSTLHAQKDRIGSGAGYGGNGEHRLAWSAAEYGPHARCVDTTRPFQVAVSFPTDAAGTLQAMEVTLSQAKHNCPLSLRIDHYEFVSEVSSALAAGVTPIISYWKSEQMLWLDGRNAQGFGSCDHDQPSECVDTVRFWGFSLEDYQPPPPMPVPPASDPTSAPASASQPQSRWPTTTSVPAQVEWVQGAYPWVRVHSEAGVYYFNQKTSVTQWEEPPQTT